MKILILLMTITSFAYSAEYKCRAKKINPVTGMRTFVHLKEVAKINPPVTSEAEYMYKVYMKVKMVAKNGASINLRPLTVLAENSDVHYSIKNKRPNVDMYMYLDEEDEAEIAFNYKRRRVVDRLVCRYIE